MKIIGGKYKGREIKGPRNNLIRPTLAKIREAFFDIISDEIKNAYFLDLYAGTGAMGIEAISRGAKKVYFVDNSKIATTLLSKNLAFIESNLYVIMRIDVLGALGYIESKKLKFDIAYIDPPYNDGTTYTDVMSNILKHNIMNNKCIIGIEHNKYMTNLLNNSFNDVKAKLYKYGDTYLTVLRRN